MAVVMSAATGNWLTAGTWGLVDATSYLNTEVNAETVGTSFGTSTAFTPGAITVDGIAVKLRAITTVSGTVSVQLAQAGVLVAGTLVTINIADLPQIGAAGSTDLNGGWILFKFAAPVTLAAATAYTVQTKVSVNASIQLFRDSTVGNVSRALRTTATGAPAAGDDIIVCGEYTGAGTSNTLTVTMDALESSILDYGSATTSQVTPAIAICSKSTLKYGTAAATAYYLRVSGCIVVYFGGEFDMGTVATPIPRDSTAKLLMDCVAEADFGIIWRNGSTGALQGLSRTSGKNVVACKLNTDEAVNSTSLGIDTDTGWLDNDFVVVASTTRTATQCERGQLNGNANAADITVDGFAGVGGGLAAVHSGTEPTQAEVILLTRNVSIFGPNSTGRFYLNVRETANLDVDWTEFAFLGFSSANKQGIQAWCTTGSLNIQYSSFRTGVSLQTTTANWSNITYANNVGYDTCIQVGPTSGTWSFTNCTYLFHSAVGSGIFATGDVGGTFTDNVAVGNNGGPGIAFGEVGAAAIGTFSNNSAHSNNGQGILIGNLWAPTVRAVLSSCVSWRNNGVGVGLSSFGLSNVKFSSWIVFGNNARNMYWSGYLSDIIFDSCVFSGDSSFATTFGFSTGGTAGVGAIAKLRFIGCTFGVASGIKVAHSTADFDLGTSSGATSFLADCVLINCLLASATEISGQGNMPVASMLGSQKHDQTAGLHKTWKQQGTIAIETGTVRAGSQGMSMTPISSATATNKLESPSFFAAVTSGATVTPTVWINKSAAYNGNQPRLVLKRNDAIGINTDTVIATYSAGTGSWNSISGVTAAATDDGVMEFVVDCDFGTGGVIYLDSISVT